MFENRLTTRLINLGYRRIDSNADGIYLFFRLNGEDAVVISVIHSVQGKVLTKEQYHNILLQMKLYFPGNETNNLQLLSLVITESLDQVRHFIEDEKEDTHWIIDALNCRLIIYENQPSDFMKLRDEIELILEDEIDASYNSKESERDAYRDNNGHDNTIRNGSYRENAPGHRFGIFTLVNSLLIILNIVAFFILHYSGLYGGSEEMMSSGALSWYLVKEEKEYYRIISSMFMHSDFRHLFNNMLVLLFVGDNLERAVGKIRYILIYFGAGIVAGITSIGYNMIKDNTVFSIGASGAIFGVVGAMLFILILNKGRLEDINSRQMILFVIFSLYGGFASATIDQAAHIGGFIGGMVLAAIVYRTERMKQG